MGKRGLTGGGGSVALAAAVGLRPTADSNTWCLQPLTTYCYRSRKRATERLPDQPDKHSVAMANLRDSRRGRASDRGGNAVSEN